ncbi:MAG: GNAT family N-acetyltransferase [Chitinophagaceae bacterium]|nr:GNAT family N-acetyltransferase [Chitinophagaceae bacterium]
MYKKVATPVLKGDRTILKPLSKSFCNQKYLSWLNDPEVYKYLSSGGDFTMKQLVNFVREKSFEDIFFWAIIVKENNNHIGNIKIDKIDKNDLHGEYGIMIGDKSVWGMGYAAEVSKIVIDFCFNVVGLKEIRLGVHKENIPAIKLYQKLGFSIVSPHSISEADPISSKYYLRMTLGNLSFCE